MLSGRQDWKLKEKARIDPWLKARSRAGLPVLELTRLLQTLIKERCNLWALLCPRTADLPGHGQLTLFNLGGACSCPTPAVCKMTPDRPAVEGESSVELRVLSMVMCLL